MVGVRGEVPRDEVREVQGEAEGEVRRGQAKGEEVKREEGRGEGRRGSEGSGSVSRLSPLRLSPPLLVIRFSRDFVKEVKIKTKRR